MRPRTRETAVALAKIAVERASWRDSERRGGSGEDGGSRLLPSLVAMPNIKQQVRRVATTERERHENLRWRSTVKTLLRRLEDAVEEGDAERIAEEHANYVRWVDKAAAKRAIHPNRAARKKSQAARLVAAAGGSD